ncbi:hypothetical protein JRQ81_003502 [Phrynocephalus forsythii]|uniref:Uncharacterized protein n=1 Tax=Phrynocephalus forsythii TaxID=171643 RepID=A0A9Q1AXI9_9SAUR|nr:hypothetical protein JRQ81_003502 [Phrynocephalus forsythii]
MASGGPIRGLCEETTCPICLEYFADPVTTDCGHNFCRACLAQCCREAGGAPRCPQCREPVRGPASWKPNRPLANIVEIARSLEGGGAGGEWRVCARHQEPLKLFCKYDEAPLCLVCDRSKEHRAHEVVPIEEVAQEYKEKIKGHLRSLEEEKEKLECQKLAKEQEMKKQLNHLEGEKDKIASAFEGMQNFLEEKKQFWLSRLEGLEKELEERKQDTLANLSEKISQLSHRIAELEKKCRQPASVYLQDIRSTLSRSKKTPEENVVDPRLKDKLRAYSEKNSSITRVMEDYRESLEQALNVADLERTFHAVTDSKKKAPNQVSVTLDPATAHPRLFLSEGLKLLRWDRVAQDLPYHPERFKRQPCVLGREQFTSGKHCWQVEILEGGPEGDLGGEPAWAIGIARHSLERKEYFTLNPSEGIWAIGKAYEDLSSPHQISAFTAQPTALMLKTELKRIRVMLSYEEGHVEFLDADSDESIFSFHPGSFSGERIRPFFYTRGWKCKLK